MSDPIMEIPLTVWNLNKIIVPVDIQKNLSLKNLNSLIIIILVCLETETGKY